MRNGLIATLQGLKGARARMWLALGIALACLGFVSLARNTGWSEPDDGATWTSLSGQVVLLETSPGGPAVRAGLQPGDILLAIDGRPVRSSVSAENRLWDEGAGPERAYRVLRNGRQEEFSLQPGSRPLPGAPVSLYLVVVGFFFLCTGTYAAIRLPASRLVTSFALLSVTLFAVLALSDTSRAEGWDWLLYWVDRIGRLGAPAAFLHFISAFIGAGRAGREGRPGRAPGIAAAWIATGIAGAFAGAGILLAISGIAGRLADPLGLIALKDRLELGFAAGCFLWGSGLLVVASAMVAARGWRRQLRWMMWGTLLGLGPFSLFYLVPVALGFEPAAWAPLAALPLIVLPLAFTAALLRYRLTDLELFLRRGVVLLSTIFFTLAAWQLMSMAVGRTVGDWLGSPMWTRGFATLVTALVYPQIRTLVRAAVDRLFYRGTYNFRRTLVAFGRELNSELDLAALVGKIENRVRQTLDLDALAVYLREADGGLVRGGQGIVGPGELPADETLASRARGITYLETDDLPPDSPAGTALRAAGLTTLFPMRVKGETRAILATGRRQDGEPLNSEDVEMLVALAGQAASAIEAARLLSELRKKVAEVERLQQTNENILESSRVAILVLDAEGRVQNGNRELEQMTGVGRDEAIGRPISELYSLPLVREIEQLIARAGEEGVSRTYRSSITNRKGDKVRVNITLSSLHERPGGEGATERSGWVVTLDDVTEHVQLEERLLRQDRLAAIGLLASSVAHEVNTPLTGISSYAQILLEGMDPSDPRHDLLLKIEKQTRRASSIANSLLNFSRGGQDAMEALDVNEVLEEALTLFEPQLRGEKLRLIRKLEGNLPRVTGHRGKLQQVILNLLLNARDAMEPDGGTITVGLRRAGSRLVLEFSDSGCGIAEEDLARIFDPFYTTKSRGKGTGLGLSLSYNIIREHRGEIGVESRKGEGTTFTIELPLDRRSSLARPAGG